jgi:hypothetical protein
MAIPKDIEADQRRLRESQEVAQDADAAEGVDVAVTGPISRAVVREILEPLTRKGSRTDPDYKVVEPTQTPPGEPEIQAPRVDEDVPPPSQDVIDDPTPVKPDPVSQAEAERVMQQREAELGTPRQVPSPSPAQLAEGIEKGPANTRFYDSDELAATVQAIAKQSDTEIKTQTVQSLYDKAFETGVPEQVLDNIFSGVPMTSKVGDNELATRLAGLQSLHDISATRVDDLMSEASAGRLDEAGQLELREALAQHQVIFSQLKGAKTDVARSLNVFKGARERRDEIGATELRSILSELGGDDELRAMAETYVTINTRANKNRVLETFLGSKIANAWIYMAQSVMLSNPNTHLYNTLANMATLVADVPERAIAIPVGSLRKRLAGLLGKQATDDQYTSHDIYARVSAFYNGILDGMTMASESIKRGDAGMKKDQSRNPVNSAYFSDTPVVLFGQEFRTRSDLADTPVGKLIDAMGSLYSIPMKSLSAGDSFMGGIAARMELHEQAWRHGARIFDGAIEDGKTYDEAMEITHTEMIKFLTERPADIEADVYAFRKQATLQADIDREAAPEIGRLLEKGNRIMNNPFVKPFVMFNKTITNIGIEGAARVPLLNFASPRFYTEYQKGGRHKDLAISRVVLGGSVMLGGYYLAMNGRITGGGPSGTEEKAAMRGAGWQEFSVNFRSGELSPASISAIKSLIGEDSVTVGVGPFDGNVYVSLKRLEPVNMPFLMAAAMADAVKFGDYEEPHGALETAGQFSQKMFDAGLAGLADYTTNIPIMTTINDFAGILNQRSYDGGDAFVAALDTVLKTYTNVGLSGTPIVGLANSSLAGYVERLIDPAASNTMATQAQQQLTESFGFEATNFGVRTFFETYNKMRSRVPIISKGVPPRYDAYGDIVGQRKPSESYPEAFSRIMGPRVTVGTYDELREFHVFINAALPNPRRSLGNDVNMNAEQYNRFIDLYANQVTIDGMNMKEYMLSSYDEILLDYEMSGQQLPIGLLQQETSSILSEFRNRAKQIMVGEFELMDGVGYEVSDEFDPEFPELSKEMRRNKTRKYYRGK